MIFGCSCSNQRNQLNENNFFYKKGIELIRQGNYEDAIKSFNRCLKQSPRSYKAYLQLALIFEDQIHDYPQALICYDKYLKLSTNFKSNDVVQKWRTRAEKKYYSVLHKVYGTVAMAEIKQKNPTIGRSTRPMSIRRNETLEEVRSTTREKTQNAWRRLVAVSSQSKLLSRNPKVKPNETRFHIVKKGDTLVQIARSYLGDAKHWKRIYSINEDVIPIPGQLRVGQKLKIPNN